jgi:uncharacterized protein
MLVVADTSVLLNLAAVGQVELLPPLFGRIVAPTLVQQEFQRLSWSEPRFRSAHWPAWVEVRQPTRLPAALLAQPRPLDPGEAAAVALAVELSADAILLDEAAGRAVAQACGLNVMGLAGILVQAKRSGRLAAVRPVLDQLMSQQCFWLSNAVRSKILLLAGEPVN